MKNVFYASLLSLLSTCSPTIITPISPTYPFKIQDYYVFVDDSKPHSYDKIQIGDRTYCYFYQILEDNHELFIYDRDCDRHSDKVLVLDGRKMMVASDTKDFDEKTIGMLNYLLQQK